MPEPLECRLDLDGLRRQRDRYRALGRHATAAERRPRRLTVRFDVGLDITLLQEAVAVERGCCPFFQIEPDAERRELVISVPEPEQNPALDAIADALGVRAVQSRSLA